MLEKLKNKETLITFAVSLFSLVFSVITFILLITNTEYISYDGSLYVRYILFYVVGIIFILGNLRIVFGVILDKNPNKPLSQSFIMFALGEITISVICGLTIVEDLYTSMRLLEDAMYLFGTMVICFLCLIALALKDSKKIFILALVIAGLSLIMILVDIPCFALSNYSVVGVDEGERTLRTVNFSYVFTAIGLIVPFISAAVYAKFLYRSETE